MHLKNKVFWIWEIDTALCLSALPLLLYGQNIRVVVLILLSYAIAAAVGLLLTPKIRTLFVWLLIWNGALGAYLIDIALIAHFRLISMEPYPLIIGQLYLFPVYFLVSGLICAAGGCVMHKTYK